MIVQAAIPERTTKVLGTLDVLNAAGPGLRWLAKTGEIRDALKEVLEPYDVLSGQRGKRPPRGDRQMDRCHRLALAVKATLGGCEKVGGLVGRQVPFAFGLDRLQCQQFFLIMDQLEIRLGG